MANLIFSGVVTSGVGKHHTLTVPGQGMLEAFPADWPVTLHPGSLNIRITEYPAEFTERGLASLVSELDSGIFRPSFEIPRLALGNNRLHPRPGVPRGGDAQVWRTVLHVGERGIQCWTLRRFGSQVGEQLELIADRRLRDLAVNDGDLVRVELQGEWRVVDPLPAPASTTS